MDPNLREWLRQHEPECLMLVRYNDVEAKCMIPPHMSDTGDWEEIGGPRMRSEARTHTGEEIAAVLINTGAMK